jgi:hypothetical protein
MNKKVLGVFGSLLVVAMLALPMSTVSATKPETMTLTGTKTLTGDVDVRSIVAGKPPTFNYIELAKNGGGDWTGDIEGFALYSGLALYKANGEFMWIGRWVFEEATIAGRTGGLRIGTMTKGNYNTGGAETKLWIESGTGELSSIRGKGTEVPPDPYDLTVWDYTFEILINP